MVTAVSPWTGRRADVMIDAAPAVSIGEIAVDLDRLLHGRSATTAAVAAPAASPGGGVPLLPFPRRPDAGSCTGPGILGNDPAAIEAMKAGFPVAGTARAVPQPLGLPVPAAAPATAGSPERRAAAPPLFVDGQRLPDDLELKNSPIRDGTLIGVGGAAGSGVTEQSGVAQIRISGGPAAGAVFQVPFGDLTIGGPGHARDRVPGIMIPDRLIAPAALRIFIDKDTFHVAPSRTMPVLLDRQPLEAAAVWVPGAQVAVGASLLDIAPWTPPDAALRPGSDGAVLEFNRPPRLTPPLQPSRFTLPAPPGRPERRPLPVLMAVVPVLLGVGMAVLFKQLFMLAFGLFTPVMLLGQWISDRRHGRKSYARQLAEHRDRTRRMEQEAHQALDTERLRRRDDCPDPGAIYSITCPPRRRLWERRHTDPDYLLLRAGTADLPSAVTLTDPSQDERHRDQCWVIPDAPVTISLSQRGVIGMAGPADVSRAAGRWLVAQVAALHSPEDVQVCILTGASGREHWDWARWLPHCRPAGQDSPVLIGNDAETVATRIAELLALIGARRKHLRAAPAGTVKFGHDVVVVFDGSRKLRSLPGVVQVLRDGPPVGVYSICLDSEERLLPAECQAVAAATADGTWAVQKAGQPPVAQVRPEYVTARWCDQVARSLAPVRDISGGDESTALPCSSRLLEVLALDPPAPEQIAARWSTGGRSTVAVIGECYDGAFAIDLRRDGPHALIAGTTGAGKSELLQTLIASLAVVNRPDELNFVLVDYKGGSAFGHCAQLPHVTGLVTDLDAHLTGRALASLSAELTRREWLLGEAGVKDIDDYIAAWDRQRRARHRAGPALEPLPRLCLVIDEFATLVRDLPEFVTGLVSIAQRGRSLGIHLILATQRPGGAVSADIRANTNLRIALRVTDPAESADVIDAPDAARIGRATPGRGYVRLGHGSLVPFQAARIGGPRPGTDGAERPWATMLTWDDIGRPEPVRPGTGEQDAEDTDLNALVVQIQHAASRLGIPAQRSPWLPPLPAAATLPDITGSPWLRGQASTLIPFGITDIPRCQRRDLAILDLDRFGHLLAAGQPVSGRSQLLRTIAGSLALHCASADAHLYGIDCGNGALHPVADLPHCGAVITRGQTERATRLLHRLDEELRHRQDQLAAGGFAGITEQRAAMPAGRRMAHVLLLLDRWEGFTATLGDSTDLTEIIWRLLAEGATVGLHLVITGDRSLVTGRMAALCENKIAFKLASTDDYALIGLRPRDVPAALPPGRALHAGTGTETQVALLAADPTGHGQAAALHDIAAYVAERDAGTPAGLLPFRVDLLPSRISFSDAWKLRPAGTGPLWGLAGVGGDTLTALGPDLADGTPGFIVAGPARSGRSAILASMARSFAEAGTQVILTTPRRSPLQQLAALPGIAATFTGTDLSEDDLSAAVAALNGPGVVVIDDADLIARCSAGTVLSDIAIHGADRGLGLVLAGDPETLGTGFGGWIADARRARRGCLTAPRTLPEGDLVGASLSRAQLGRPVRPGQALLNTGDGTLITITVPDLPSA